MVEHMICNLGMGVRFPHWALIETPKPIGVILPQSDSQMGGTRPGADPPTGG